MNITHVYNVANEISSTGSDGRNVGGIVGRQDNGNTAYAYTKYAYNTAKIIGNRNVGGIAGSIWTGTMNNTFNIGEIAATSTNNVGQIAGKKYNTTAITNSNSVSRETMIGWSQETITTKLKNFVKKTNALPILDMTVRNITF